MHSRERSLLERALNSPWVGDDTEQSRLAQYTLGEREAGTEVLKSAMRYVAQHSKRY